MKPALLLWPLLAAAVLYLGLRRFERAMVFAPSREMLAHPGTVGLAYEPLMLTASDGVRLRAWWIPGPSAESPVMLCLHGNGGNLSHRTDKMRLFHDAGAAQLWLEWRGYGESGGRPDEPGLYRDALAGWAWLSAVKALPAARLVLYGESLGNGPAIELATRVPAAGLIVDSAFTSVADMSRRILPRFPPRLLSLRFDNLSRLPRVTIPTLFLHSPEDDIIPYEMARRNYAASGAAQKSLVDLKGSHNEGFLDAGSAYPKAIRNFLASLPKEAPKP
ncbi:MAG: alpha/beta hydrolase [Elusimicrobia bacterium]|nr:alpha/beta hydrolase [Elusimicrobiota bacterium]